MTGARIQGWRRGTRAVCRAAVAGGLLAAGVASGFESVEAFTGFLESHAIAYDRTSVVAAAISGVLARIDPGARFVSADEARALTEGGGTSAAASGSVVRVTLDAVELWPEGMAYLKVGALGPGSGAEVMEHLRCLGDRTGVVLDLRGTDGTDLESAAVLAGPFRNEGERLFSVNDLSGGEQQAYTATSAPACRMPLMVLIDRDTRGSAEVMAACCRGSPGVMLIGTSTRGDALLRELLPLPDGSYLHVATRRVVPAGRPGFERTGVEPDIGIAAFDPGVFANGDTPARARLHASKTPKDHELLLRVHHDVALRRAVDILLGLRALDHARL